MNTLKEKQHNLVKILCIALPFVLGFAITYASGILRLYASGGIAMDLNWNGYGFPLGWSSYSGVDFIGFLADFLFWSGIFAAAFWLFYYVNHALST